eukprot:126109_1
MTSKKDNDDCTGKSPPTYMATYWKDLRSRRIKLKATADELHSAWADRKFRFYQAKKKGKGKGKGIQSEVDKLHAEWKKTNKEVEAVDREIFSIQMMIHAHKLKHKM